jgi:hypothetical protein
VACLSCQAKIKGTIKRAYRMKNRRENIDLLLESNTAEQMARVDWEGLNAAISSRLARAEKYKTSSVRFPTVFKVAAGFVVAAAVVFIAVMVNKDVPPAVRLENRGNAVVKFIDKKSSTAIEIELTESKARVMVDIEAGQRRLAKVDVKIIDRNGQRKEDDSRPAWIIISRPEPVFADNGTNRDEIDLICLM